MKKDWIKKLPPGKYTMQQLKLISGSISHGSIKNRMIKYGAYIIASIPSNHSNLKNIYYWPGFPKKTEPKEEKIS